MPPLSLGGAAVKNLPADVGDSRDMGLIPGLGRSPGGGNGNPLQYSYLETPMDRGAWWVPGDTKSWHEWGGTYATQPTCSPPNPTLSPGQGACGAAVKHLPKAGDPSPHYTQQPEGGGAGVGNGIVVHDFKCVYVLFLICFTKLEYCHKYKLLIMSFILNILSLSAPNCSKLLEFKFQLACLRSNLSFLLLFMVVFPDYLGRRVKFSSKAWSFQEL